MNKAEMKEKLAGLYDCGTCNFMHYDSKDINESRKCSLMGSFNTVLRNRELEEIIAKYDLKNVCEAWGPRK